MSEIDGFDNSHLGSFCGVPVYHVMETKLNSLHYPTKLNAYCIGGGSGEHSMFIIYNIDVVIDKYLAHRNNRAPLFNDVADYEYFWSIEECHALGDDISELCNKYDVNIYDKMVMFSVADYVCRHGREFIRNRYLRDEAEQLTDFWDIITVEEDPYGKVILNEGKLIKWGVSYTDDIQYYLSGELL